MTYIKICKNPRCRKEFESESRNAAYCSDECRSRHYAERSKRRKQYKENLVENSVVSKAYRLANEVADLFYPSHICEVCGSESTHVHHKDLNIFNNDPSNLMRVCEPCHKKIHSTLPRINMVTTLHECLTIREENPSVDIVSMFRAKFNKEAEND